LFESRAPVRSVVPCSRRAGEEGHAHECRKRDCHDDGCGNDMQLVYRLTLFVRKPLSSAPSALDETQPKRPDTGDRSELAHQRAWTTPKRSSPAFGEGLSCSHRGNVLRTGRGVVIMRLPVVIFSIGDANVIPQLL
jgi:hypothetical protein